MDDLNPISLIALRDAIASRRLSAADAVAGYLARIEAADADLNAFHEVFAERARERAQAVDRGEVTGVLAGVPIAIKDNLCTEYGLTTCSSRILENYRSPFTATAVRKLEATGAIVLGKTNMDEFAMGSSGEHAAGGPTRNPWDPSRVTGGSSGGSAAAVAAGMAAGALGSDTGGSIRQPAAFCGVVGLKPTYGRVSRWGLIAYASSLDQIGPFGRTVEDVALLLSVIAGHDPLDSTAADVPVEDYLTQLRTPPARPRIGIAKQYLSDSNDPAIAKAFERAVNGLKEAGAAIVEVDLPHTEYGIPTYYIVATAEASSNLARYDGVRYGRRAANCEDLMDVYARSRSEGFGDEVKRRIMLGTYVLSSGYYDAYYLKALKVRRLIKNDFDRAFESCDVILCPTTPTPAFGIGEKTDDPLAMYLADVYTVNCNLAGLPGLSLSAGWTNGGGPRLPVGLQLLGPAFGEGKLLGIARMLEGVLGLPGAMPSRSVGM